MSFPRRMASLMARSQPASMPYQRPRRAAGGARSTERPTSPAMASMRLTRPCRLTARMNTLASRRPRMRRLFRSRDCVANRTPDLNME